MLRAPRGRALLGAAALALAVCVVVYMTIVVVLGRQVLSFPGSNGMDEARVEAFDLYETAEESKCFHCDALESVEPIPNVVHFTWGLVPESRMSFINYLAVRSALETIRPDALKIHYAYLAEDDVWLQRLLEQYNGSSVTLVSHDMAAEYPRQVMQRWQVSHLADVLRLDVLYGEGGIYLDMDVISLRPFDTLRGCHRDVVLGHEGGSRHGLCNAVILARPNAAFLARWIGSYGSFSPKQWNYHSVLLPKKLQLAPENTRLVCPLSPTAFFWPTWTDRHVRYMHEPISDDDAAALDLLLAATGGSIYPNQLAYHAWSQVAWSPYLQHLTPKIVKEKNTRFNVMVRRFVS